MKMKTASRLLGAVAALCAVLPGMAAAQGVKGCDHTMLRGQYVFTASGFTRSGAGAEWVPKAIQEFLAFNGDGTVTTPAVTVVNPGGNSGAVIEARPGNSGTYVVNDDCTGQLTFADSVAFRIYVAPRGDEFWLLQLVGLGGSQNVFQGVAKRLW
jgi:hypothetical protein